MRFMARWIRGIASDAVFVENSDPVWSQPCTQIDNCGRLFLKRFTISRDVLLWFQGMKAMVAATPDSRTQRASPFRSRKPYLGLRFGSSMIQFAHRSRGLGHSIRECRRKNNSGTRPEK